jgi:predicted metal-dependent hydrolase
MTTGHDGEVRYSVKRSNRRRTADIVVERDGQVLVRLPKRFPDVFADKLISLKKYWVLKSLAEWRTMNSSRIGREFRSGEGFLYLGSSYRLALVSGQEETLLLKDGRFLLKRSILREGSGAAQAAFRAFYIEKGQERIERRVAYYAPKVGVVTDRITVKELGYRWASCGSKASLRFHWKCMMAPPKIIDYIVVHELCHLHQRDHTQAFWNEVDKVMSDYRERRAWLKENGAALDIC